MSPFLTDNGRPMSSIQASKFVLARGKVPIQAATKPSVITTGEATPRSLPQEDSSAVRAQTCHTHDYVGTANTKQYNAFTVYASSSGSIIQISVCETKASPWLGSPLPSYVGYLLGRPIGA